MSDLGLVCLTLVKEKSSKTPFDLLSFGVSEAPSPACHSASVPAKINSAPTRALTGTYLQEFKLISFKRDRPIGLQIPNTYQDHSLSWSQFEII